MEEPLHVPKPLNPIGKVGTGGDADPCNRVSFLARVGTFKPSTWFAKPLELSPLVCARRGWVNIKSNFLQCVWCGACASFEFPTQMAHGLEGLLEDLVKTLTDAHDPECPWATGESPVEFERLQTVPRSSVLGELVVRLDQLNQVWDLPKLKSNLSSHIESGSVLETKLKKLLEWNLGRMKDAYTQGGTVGKDGEDDIQKIDTSVVSDEEWEKRNIKLVTLALMGWKVHVLPSKVYLRLEDEEQACALGKKRKRPWQKVYTKPGNPNKGYALGRETILHCEYCAAQAGMWGFGSEPGIELLKFQRISSRNAARAQELKQKGSKSEPGNGEGGVISSGNDMGKSLVGTIAGGSVSKFGLKLESGVFGSAAASTLFQMKDSENFKEPRPSLESLLAATTPARNDPGAIQDDQEKDQEDTAGSVFGLGSYKKRKAVDSQPVEVQLVEKGSIGSQEHDGAFVIAPGDYAETVENLPFDPVGWHRYFCPWSAGWKDILNSLVE